MSSSVVAVEQKQVESLPAGSFQVDPDTGTVKSCTSFRLSPPRRKQPRNNNNDNFHADLHGKLPHIVVTWEGRAREGIAVCLSSSLKGTTTRTEVVLGAAGNTETRLFHQHKNNSKNKQRIVVPGRVCREGAWIHYWLCYDEDTSVVAVGIGSIPGQQCIATMNIAVESSTTEDDTTVPPAANNENNTEQQAVRRYVGFRNAAVWDRQAPSDVLLRNITVGSSLPSILAQPEPMIIVGEDDELSSMERETIRLLQKHRDECQKAQARATKFGTPYVPPKLSTSMPYSELRRLRANPTGTLASTGMDLQSTEEQEKLEKRKNRFGIATVEEKTPTPTNDDTVIPCEEAWDKMDLVGEQRVDPPPELWLEPPAYDNDKNGFQMMMNVDPPALLPAKIHIFSMDWAAFKQIRTKDIEKFFDGYGTTTYIEWLGDLSCNIHFPNAFAASKAMDALSQELPRDKIPDLAVMGWRLAKSMVCKRYNDRYGRKGTKARLLMRVATSRDVLVERPSSWKQPPGEFSTTKVLGPDSDVPKEQKKGRKRKQKRGPRTTEELLQGGLSAGRGGFSVEDIEGERSSKKKRTDG